uniref:EF-hand domain-containing protein n=1 Tax=Macrostomum lignano TaxID=282301 RepID=A0A1I8IAC4_9PLAT
MDSLDQLIRSLDPSRSGQLNRVHLAQLCAHFTLSKEETNRVVRTLLPDPRGSVSELRVRVEFPKVIREQIVPPNVSSENESEGSLAEPKYVRDDGRVFGRRTRPKQRNLGGEDKDKPDAAASTGAGAAPDAKPATATSAPAEKPPTGSSATAGSSGGATASAAAIALAAATAPAAAAGFTAEATSKEAPTAAPEAQPQPSAALATVASRSRSPTQSSHVVAPQPIKPTATVEEPASMTSSSPQHQQQQ